MHSRVSLIPSAGSRIADIKTRKSRTTYLTGMWLMLHSGVSSGPTARGSLSDYKAHGVLISDDL